MYFLVDMYSIEKGLENAILCVIANNSNAVSLLLEKSFLLIAEYTIISVSGVKV